LTNHILKRRYVDPYESSPVSHTDFVWAIAEHIVLSSASPSFRTTAIRSHGIIGPNDNNIVPLLATAPRSVSFGSGTNLYDFSSASNVALAHVLAIENLLSSQTEAGKSANGKAFFVTDQRPLPMRKVMEMIWDCLDYDNIQNDTERSQAPTIVIPVCLAYGIIWGLSSLAKMLGKEPWISTSELGDSVSVRYFDNSSAKNILGYVPQWKLEDSIRAACRTYKAGNGKKP
jgi:sterol-4alpha-carboxylate 3-dehydrogenase (decarboxylating)